ncbi:Bgt-125 [Blumeria graminis f. sp. tritici]|uniref:MutL C-terminal dimerisation domain-containing protein n=3 Tax=Blumeria graminis f. sp. tritici TaxID=62690 RepID=A0A656KK84_BLUGR|nr:hypothetical protein BGT96224_125 [Blumeria graminis f. sp. tritici 96224]VCU40435.1 Bgt-125 [Blumeria graminis f. sp. tritici]
MSIRLLSHDVIKQINSSVEIADMNVVICELFKNSLDANSTRVELSVDYRQRACIVEDNGFGIPPSEFSKNGGLGKLNYSSKPIFHFDFHGGKGTFLAFLSNLSLLKITSRHRLYRSCNTLVLQHSNVLSRHVPAPLWEKISFDHGTKVTVNDLFGGMPVRIKHCTENIIKWQKDEKEWSILVNEIVKLVFAWRDNVEVIMRNPSSHKKLIIRYPNSSASAKDPGLKVCTILRQVSLNTVEDRKSWVTVEASNAYAKILGTISLLPCSTKKYQFISFGIRPLNEKKHLLFDQINCQFNHSDFGAASRAPELCHDLEEKPREDETYRQSFGLRVKESIKNKKCIDRWPKFYLKFTLYGLGEEVKTSADGNPGGEDCEETSNMVTGLLQKMIEDFLRRNNFRPNTNQCCCPGKSKHSMSGETLVEEGNFGEPVLNPVSKSVLTRIQKSHKTSPDIRTTKDIFLSSQELTDSNLFAGPVSKIGSKAAAFNAIQDSTLSFDTGNTAKNNTKRMTIQNKVTQNLTFVAPSVDNLPRKVPESIKHSIESLQNDTTHIVVSPPPEISRIGRKQTEKAEISGISTTSVDSYPKKSLKVDHFTSLKNASRGLKLSMPSEIPKHQNTGIIARLEHNIPRNLMLLDKRKDPVNSTAEKQCQFPTSTNLIIQDLICDQSSNFFHNESYLNLTGLANLNLCVHRDDLRHAEIIAQVDKKFILVKLSQIQNKMKGNKESILVMVDQHAADERIRIESLLKELCIPEKTSSSGSVNRVCSHTLKTPINFELLLDELNILSLYKAHFIRWGIVFEVCSDTLVSHEATIYGNVRIISLPPTIFNRCTRQPHLLLELIRLEIKKLREQDQYDLTEPHNLENTCWYNQILTCPAGILELLTSRACRSAVMFNDELSREASQTIVRELASCKYPFQCAHGRPSLVPLLTLTNLNFSSQKTQISDKRYSPGGLRTSNFTDKFRAWKNLQLN